MHTPQDFSDRVVDSAAEGQGATLFIANRGEIALRIIRTASAMGYRTAVMHVPEEAEAPYVQFADAAVETTSVHQGGTAPFLTVETVVTAATDIGADLLHPGYGFLSEIPELAEAVSAAGIRWVGPPPAAIRRLADKVSAREVAAKVGAPLAPGSKEPVADGEAVTAFAQNHGYPVVIKAAHGGGGRGMRVVWEEGEAEGLLESARSEARTSFGNEACFVERFLERPRHIETQCLADSYGHVVVLGTRDCSVQRRNQKLIEEAPAPGLTKEQLEALTDASRRILLEVGYQGAGTCEFLLAQDGTISFLEVNTRLQVEHTVTEEVTGIDLVEQQLCIAHGETLDLRDHSGTGVAMEFRINAEDPGAEFFPSVGKLTEYHAPAGLGIRVDSGVQRGSSVTPLFDSMIAKLIVSGSDRGVTIARAQQALREFRVEGITTVVPVHQKVLQDTAFRTHGNRSEGVYTKWLEEDFLPRHSFPSSGAAVGSGVSAAGAEDEALFDITIDGTPHTLGLPPELASSGAPPSKPRPPKVIGLNSALQGDPAQEPSEELPGTVLRAPAQAMVSQLLVDAGVTVAADEPLLVLEVMKMEYFVKAPHPGTVGTITCSPGEDVVRNVPLLNII